MVSGLASKKIFHLVMGLDSFGIFILCIISLSVICLLRFWEGLDQLRWCLDFIHLSLEFISKQKRFIGFCGEHKSLYSARRSCRCFSLSDWLLCFPNKSVTFSLVPIPIVLIMSSVQVNWRILGENLLKGYKLSKLPSLLL